MFKVVGGRYVRRTERGFLGCCFFALEITELNDKSMTSQSERRYIMVPSMSP